MTGWNDLVEEGPGIKTVGWHKDMQPCLMVSWKNGATRPTKRLGFSQSGDEQVTRENFSGIGSSQWLIETPVRLQAQSGLEVGSCII